MEMNDQYGAAYRLSHSTGCGGWRQVSSGSGDSNASGKFSWRVHNFPLFREMIKTQKIMSPVFMAGECSLRLSVYQSSVSGVEYMSMW